MPAGPTDEDRPQADPEPAAVASPVAGAEPAAKDDLAEYTAIEAELDQRWPETRIAPSLDRIEALVDLLGSPQRAYPLLHVAGTNGKSSVTRMIDALLTETGLRTGRYTSPHLQLAVERIALDGVPISLRRYVEVYRDVAPYVEMVDGRFDVRLSKFEVLTAMAFAAFADAPVEVAAIEVGLGGRWDATNVADGAVAVVTPIGVDHVDYLGADIAGIAAEKAGIIKPGSIVVLAAQPADVDAVLEARRAELGVTVARQGKEFGVLDREIAVGGQLLRLQGLGGVYDEVFLPLHGEHQAANAALALAAVEAFLGAAGDRQLDVDGVRASFAHLVVPGRLERVRAGPSGPAVFVDAAHNPHGMRALAGALRGEFAFSRLVAVVGVMRDKDVRGMLAELESVVQEIVVTANSSPRSADADELAAVAVEIFGADRVIVEPRLADAIEAAVELAEEAGESGGGVVVTGSVVTAGEARSLFGKRPG